MSKLDLLLMGLFVMALPLFMVLMKLLFQWISSFKKVDVKETTEEPAKEVEFNTNPRATSFSEAN